MSNRGLFVIRSCRLLVRIQSGAPDQPCRAADIHRSVTVLGSRRGAEKLDELGLIARLRDVSPVLAVHDEESHPLDVISLGYFLGALQFRADREFFFFKQKTAYEMPK